MAPVGHRPGFMNLPDLRWLSPPKWKPPEKEAPPLDQEAKPSTENALSKKQGAKQNARSRTPDKGSPPPRQGRLWETFAARGETLVPFRQKDQSPPKKRVNDQPRDTEPANLKGAEISIPVRWPVPALPMPLEQGRATGDTVTVACNAALSSAEKGNGAAHRDELCTLNGMEGPPLAKPSSPPAQPFEVKLLVRERKVPAVQLFPHAAAPPAVVPPPLAVPPPSAEPPLTPPEVIARGRFFSPPCAARDKVLLSPSLRVGTTALRGRVADLISPGRPFRSPRSKFFSPPR